MQTFDILDPKLDVFHNRFLEASAGTGKTFAIEHLIVRLLLESEEPIRLSEILAVTFTREAAHEMKVRIRSKLESLASRKNPRVREALIQFDEAQVFTIHAFCHRMLTEFAFEANAPLGLGSADQPSYLQEMRQTIEDYLHTGAEEYAQEVAALFKRARFDLDRLVGQIMAAIQKDEDPQTLPLPKVSLPNLDDLKEDIILLAPRYKRMNTENALDQFDRFAGFLKTQDLSVLLEEKEWFFEKMHEENAKVRAQPLKNLSLKAPTFFKEIHAELVPYLKKRRNPKEMLKKVARECAKRWKIKAMREDHFTFDDLLYKMNQALSHPGFLEKVQKKYKAVVVDEFQDTDPLQWKIFKRLFLENHLLYLVGDPKQSIYGFRNADIYTYMEAAEALGEENRAILDTNFRSNPQLVDALNKLFTHRPEWIALPSLPGALSYHPVKAGRNEQKIQEDPIHYFGAQALKGREKSWPTRQMEEEKLFPYIASEIIRLHKEYRVPFSEMAVLIKDRFQAQRLGIHLNKWKVPSTIKKAFNLAESRGFFALESLLKAVYQPENDRLARAVIYGPLQCGEKVDFFSLKKLFEEKGFTSFLKTFLAKYSGAHHDTSLYLELRQTAEVLMQSHSTRIEEVFYEMEELKKLNPEVDERLKLQTPEGEDAVWIMTTFASKGLEFDVVFALGPACRHLEEEATADIDAEKMRQLYVAFTRSREKLYIPILKEATGVLEQRSAIDLFFKEAPLSVEWIKDREVTPFSSSREDKPLFSPPLLNLIFKEEYLTSFSSMARPHSNVLLAEKFRLQETKIKTAHTLPLGAETGTLIHAVFENYFQNPTVGIEQLCCEVLAGTHLEGWEEVVYEVVKTTLTLPLMEGFSLSQLKEEDYFQEMEFLFTQNNQLVKGFIDLVFRRNDQFYIVDWKTNWLGPSREAYTHQALQQAMEEHDYYLQAKLYKEAVERYVKRFYKEAQFLGAYYIFVRGKGVAYVGPC